MDAITAIFLPLNLLADVAPPGVFLVGGLFVVIAGLALTLAFVIGGLYLIRRFRARNIENSESKAEKMGATKADGN